MANSRPGEGRSWRLFALEKRSPYRVTGWLEDDFHHFGVTIDHEDGIISRVATASPRTPWVSCPLAGEPLRQLVGKPLVARASDIGGLLDMRQQCTHMFDLAGLALAFAHRGEERRDYEVEIPDRHRRGLSESGHGSFGEGQAILRLNGELVMHWHLDGSKLTAPEKWAGQDLGIGFRAWTESLGLDQGEYAHILRRALLIAGGRTITHDDFPAAGDQLSNPVCFSFQPERSATAWRNMGATIDYSAAKQGMLQYRAMVPGDDIQ